MFGLVEEAREKLLEVPSVALLLVVLVPLLVGVALGVVLQKFRAEALRVRTLQDLLVFLPKVGRKDCHAFTCLRNANPHRIATKVACEYCLRDLHLVPPTASASWGGVEDQCSAQ